MEPRFQRLQEMATELRYQLKWENGQYHLTASYTPPIHFGRLDEIIEDLLHELPGGNFPRHLILELAEMVPPWMVVQAFAWGNEAWMGDFQHYLSKLTVEDCQRVRPFITWFRWRTELYGAQLDAQEERALLASVIPESRSLAGGGKRL